MLGSEVVETVEFDPDAIVGELAFVIVIVAASVVVLKSVELVRKETS